METFKYNKNLELPQLGFGPGIMSCNQRLLPAGGIFAKAANKFYYRPSLEKCYVNAISTALKMGYHLLDYSTSYGNWGLFGQGIRKSGVDRKKLFITTRVSNEAQRTFKVRDEFFRFLKETKLEYVDLLQFHWPVPGFFLDTWREMEKLLEEGYVKHLGVANCHQHHIEEILKICKYRPEIGQFEIHPLFTQKKLVNYYQSQGIAVEAYTALARYDDRLMRLPLLKELGEKYKKNVVQIILRWHIQCGVIPVVRAMSYEHQKTNIEIFDFSLSDKDIERINSININSRLRFDPDNCDFSIL